MTRVLRKDCHGQSALFDGMVFFVIMVIASVLVFVSASIAFQEREVVSNKDLIVFTREALDAYLSASVPVATYTDRNGETVPLYNHTILDLLLIELSLLDDGLNGRSFNRTVESVNNVTLIIGERLVGGTGLHFALLGTFRSSNVSLLSKGFVSLASMPFERFTSSVTTSMAIVGKQGIATIELADWV